MWGKEPFCCAAAFACPDETAGRQHLCEAVKRFSFVLQLNRLDSRSLGKKSKLWFADGFVHRLDKGIDDVADDAAFTDFDFGDNTHTGHYDIFRIEKFSAHDQANLIK